jgi:hypothetical protein
MMGCRGRSAPVSQSLKISMKRDAAVMLEFHPFEAEERGGTEFDKGVGRQGNPAYESEDWGKARLAT